MPAGHDVRQMRRHDLQQRDRHSGRLVRFRIQPPGRARHSENSALAVRHVSRRRRSVSRLVPQLAAGGRGLEGRAPYRECATNGWTLDGEGRAMSKSLGNVIEPEKIIKQYGAEVLRLWVASVEFNEDVRLSDTILARLTEAYRKLRNTFRYALGNLGDFDPATDAVPADELLEIDQWILLEAEDLVRKCRGWYDEYAFHKVYRAVYDFATVQSELRVFRHLEGPSVHGCAEIARARRSAQTAIHPHQLCVGATAGALARLHYRRSLVVHEEAGRRARRAYISRCSPNRENSVRAIPTTARVTAAGMAPLMEVRKEVLKAWSRPANEKEIGRRTRGPGHAIGQRRDLSAAREIRAGISRTCSSFRRWHCCRKARNWLLTSNVQKASSASAAGSTHRTSELGQRFIRRSAPNAPSEVERFLR